MIAAAKPPQFNKFAAQSAASTFDLWSFFILALR
jgi:hypothetical protein